MTRAIVTLTLVTLLGLAGCGAVSGATATADAGGLGIDAGAPAPDAPAPDAPTPTTWVSRFYDVTSGPVSPEAPAWGWTPAERFSGPLTADPNFGGFVINTFGRSTPTREAVSHALTPRATYALQVNYGFEPATAFNIPVGPRVQVDDPTAPLGFRWESGFSVQVGDRPGEALLIWGGADAGVGWADGSQSRAFPEGDYAPGAAGTLTILVDTHGTAEVNVAGLTLRHPAFHVGSQVVLGDASAEDGADASAVISLVVQFEPPGGVNLDGP